MLLAWYLGAVPPGIKPREDPVPPTWRGQTFIDELLRRIQDTPIWNATLEGNPVLNNPHQTCNAIASILKDQQHALSVAAANASTAIPGAVDSQGQQLYQKLALWQSSMSDLSRGYQQLQGVVSGMVHSQQRTLGALKNMYETYDSHVELMKAEPACQVSSVTGVWNRWLGQEQLVGEACIKQTAVLLRSCNDATSRARPTVNAHLSQTQQVREQQDSLASDLEIVADRMQAVIAVAVDQKNAMLLAGDNAKVIEEKSSRACQVGSTSITGLECRQHWRVQSGGCTLRAFGSCSCFRLQSGCGWGRHFCVGSSFHRESRT